MQKNLLWSKELLAPSDGRPDLINDILMMARDDGSRPNLFNRKKSKIAELSAVVEGGLDTMSWQKQAQKATLRSKLEAPASIGQFQIPVRHLTSGELTGTHEYREMEK